MFTPKVVSTVKSLVLMCGVVFSDSTKSWMSCVCVSGDLLAAFPVGSTSMIQTLRFCTFANMDASVSATDVFPEPPLIDVIPITGVPVFGVLSSLSHAILFCFRWFCCWVVCWGCCWVVCWIVCWVCC